MSVSLKENRLVPALEEAVASESMGQFTRHLYTPTEVEIPLPHAAACMLSKKKNVWALGAHPTVAISSQPITEPCEAFHRWKRRPSGCELAPTKGKRASSLVSIA